MVWGDLQSGLYLITLILALSTAILGLISANTLFKNKLKELFSDINFFIFFFLIFGYICFALAELCWYLLFKLLGEMPSASMPDVYWIAGSVFLLIAFVTFSAHMHKNQGSYVHVLSSIILTAVILGLVIVYVYIINAGGATVGNIFLGYFYPIMSSLILISSLSVFLFYKNIGLFKTNFLLLVLANLAFLGGDLLYVYITFTGGYGSAGILSDILYIAAYSLCTVSFLSLLIKTKAYNSSDTLYT